ncbi:MAG TPA: hypothetical protein DCM05_00195, partial [Elusimicrobia bacterium]|nr:hypothetical protein [Elusimicrobiota bacterium]
MKKKAWLIDALIGLAISLFVAGSYYVEWAPMEGLELKAYDMRAKFRQRLETPAEPVIIAIDDDSIARIGRWPWPRTRIAEMLDLLSAANPKVVALNIVYSEPERNPAIADIENLRNQYLELVQARKIIQKGVEFDLEFSSIALKLDTDSKLLASLTTAQNVVLPMFFSGGGTIGGKAEEVPAALSSATLSVRVTQAPPGLPIPPIEGSKPVYPILPFLESAAGIGHVNIYPDFDGVVRREVPAIKYGDKYYPSYALALVARSQGLKPEEISIAPGRSITMGKIQIPLEDGRSMLVTYNGPDHFFRYYSFHEVMNGKVSMDVFKDKIVILGPSASGIATLYATPVAPTLPSVEYVANVIENILSQRFLARPAWALKAELGLIAFFALFIMFGLPRLRALGGATVTTLLLAGVAGAGFYLFVERGEWIKVVYPAFLLVAGYLIIQTKRFVFTEKGKELVEASAIETNKMLGLSFQGQGMLDLAFEKFRLCPLDDNMKETLYNLSLDYERKRQYGKAVNVYKHISGADPKYKDIEVKIKTLGAAAEGAVFGGIGGKSAEGTVMITGGAQKPMLGRYEILKELGRGAMGIVYLGKDPKINRQVAIKTLMLEEGGTPEETKQIKERFFREAESAGTLNHPNIVRIFDAGEEQEVCYIAMELLDGHDLCKFGTKEGMLEPLTAMEYVAQVADGLDYAHAQGIVHRDIKPANIMLLKDGSIRVADFGIARITASSKTATGTVMGTPSYMSPEQIAGKKVDGRSDLFSLGVTLYELLTGEKPFKGGEGIGTLLFQIANDPEPEPAQVNPKLPQCASRVIHKALKKNADERYQRGSELAADLRACIAAIKSGKDTDAVGAPPPQVVVPAAAPAPAAAAPSGFQAPPGAGERSTDAPALTAEEAASTLILQPGEVPKAAVNEPSFEPAPSAPEPPAPAVSFEPAPAPEPAAPAVSFELPPAEAAPASDKTDPVEAQPQIVPAEALQPAGGITFDLPPAAAPAPEVTTPMEPQPQIVPAEALQPAGGITFDLPPVPEKPAAVEHGFTFEPAPAAGEPAPAAPAAVEHGFTFDLPGEKAEPAAAPSIDIELGPQTGTGAADVPLSAANPALGPSIVDVPPPSSEIELGPAPALSVEKTIRIDSPPKPAGKPLTPEEIAFALPVELGEQSTDAP